MNATCTVCGGEFAQRQGPGRPWQKCDRHRRSSTGLPAVPRVMPERPSWVMSIEDAADHGTLDDLRLACLWNVAAVLDDPATPARAWVQLSGLARQIMAELGDLPASRRRAPARGAQGAPGGSDGA